MSGNPEAAGPGELPDIGIRAGGAELIMCADTALPGPTDVILTVDADGRTGPELMGAAQLEALEGLRFGAALMDVMTIEEGA